MSTSALFSFPSGSRLGLALLAFFGAFVSPDFAVDVLLFHARLFCSCFSINTGLNFYFVVRPTRFAFFSRYTRSSKIYKMIIFCSQRCIICFLIAFNIRNESYRTNGHKSGESAAAQYILLSRNTFMFVYIFPTDAVIPDDSIIHSNNVVITINRMPIVFKSQFGSFGTFYAFKPTIGTHYEPRQVQDGNNVFETSLGIK